MSALERAKKKIEAQKRDGYEVDPTVEKFFRQHESAAMRQ
jgi:hypothetical protein